MEDEIIFYTLASLCKNQAYSGPNGLETIIDGAGATSTAK